MPKDKHFNKSFIKWKQQKPEVPNSD